MFGIMDIRDEGTKNFLQSQTLVNFQKLWSTHDEIIKNKKNRAEMLIEQFNKTKNLNFLVNHDENFSYSGF